MAHTRNHVTVWLKKISATIAASVLAFGATAAIADEPTPGDNYLTKGRIGLYIKGDASGESHKFDFPNLTMTFKRADGTRVDGKQDVSTTTVGNPQLKGSAGYFDLMGQPEDTVEVIYGGKGGWGFVDGNPMYFDTASGISNELYNPLGLKSAAGFFHAAAPYGVKFTPELAAGDTTKAKVEVTAIGGSAPVTRTFEVKPSQVGDDGYGLQSPAGFGDTSDMNRFRFVKTNWKGEKTGDYDFTFAPIAIEGYRLKVHNDNVVWPGMRVEYVKLHSVTFEKADPNDDVTIPPGSDEQVEHGSTVSSVPAVTPPEDKEVYWTVGDNEEAVNPKEFAITGPTVFKLHVRDASEHTVYFKSEGIEPPINTTTTVKHGEYVTELPAIEAPEGKIVQWTMNTGTVPIDPTKISIIATTTFTAHLADAPVPTPEPTEPAPEPTKPGPEPTEPAPEPTEPAPVKPTSKPAPPAPGKKPNLPITGTDSTLLVLAGLLVSAGAATTIARKRLHSN